MESPFSQKVHKLLDTEHLDTACFHLSDKVAVPFDVVVAADGVAGVSE
jgi:hypothetical protein